MNPALYDLMSVATGERTNLIPYIAIGVAVVVLAVLLLLPKFTKKK